MNGWDGYSSDSGAEHEPSEERGQAAWSARPPVTPPPGTVPPWSSAQTQTGQAPPPWASAETQVGGARPPAWPPPPPTPGPVVGPPTGPIPAPAPAPRHGARRVLVALTVTAVLGAGSGAGVWYFTRGNATGAGATPATSVSVTVTTTPSATDPATPWASPLASSSSSPSPSVGYRRAQDPIGYAVDVPQGWNRREKQGKFAPVVYYDAPGGNRQLQIFEVTEATPYDSLTLAEKDPGFGFAKQPGYQVLERDRGDTWAELSYRYEADDNGDKGSRQVVDHRFQAADGTLYAIRSSGPADLDPALVRDPLAMAVRSFCPTGADCT